MTLKCFAIKNHRIVGEVAVSPFSEQRMNAFVRESGYDGWFYMDKHGAMKLLDVRGK